MLLSTLSSPFDPVSTYDFSVGASIGQTTVHFILEYIFAGAQLFCAWISVGDWTVYNPVFFSETPPHHRLSKKDLDWSRRLPLPLVTPYGLPGSSASSAPTCLRPFSFVMHSLWSFESFAQTFFSFWTLPPPY